MGEAITPPKTDESPQAWHHCGRCGTLFQAAAGSGNQSPCPACRRHPAPDYDSWQRKQAFLTPGASRRPPDMEFRRRGGKTTRLNATRLIAVFIIAWLCFLALLVVAAKLLWKEAPPSAQTPHGGAFGQTGESADSLLLRNAFSECAAALNGFFDAAAPESRAQFAIDPLEAVQSLTTTDLFSPLTSENGTKKNLLAEVIHTPRGPAIETVWETRQGTKLDAVFFKDKETWKIDWREMVRFSPRSWAMFLAETGEGEEEFRLLARERLEGERGQHHGMVLVFYSPHFGHMRDAGSPSPEFPVDIQSPDGRLLAAAFAAKKEGRGPFGSHMISSDPEDLIRVRVRIRRNPPDTRPRFTLTKVIACHWFSLDEPGYDIPPAKGNQP